MKRDERLSLLAKSVLTNSLRLKEGEKVYIDTSGTMTIELLAAFVEETVKLGAVPFYYYNDTYLRNCFFVGANEEQMKVYADIHSSVVQQMDAYIGIRCHDNPIDFTLMGEDKLKDYNLLFSKPFHLETVAKKRWVILHYPSPVAAFQANMPTSRFEDFYFSACLADYNKMYHAMLPLKNLIERTDRVRIVAPDTDLSFSVKGIGATPCSGLTNIPDGEIYTAPIVNSANGKICFNTSTIQSGFVFRNISLTFKDGEVIEAKADGMTEQLQIILSIDKGAKYLGEFAFGVNPHIRQAVGDTLFDEKISGSIHLALGDFCGNADNGNHSSIHWDLVQIHTPEYGGGEVWFDDVLIRKDGRFVLKELQPLNPENLRGI